MRKKKHQSPIAAIPKPHPSKSIAIKRGDIDLPMIPLIEWMNEFEFTYTQYCCQGSETQDPYIIFLCWDVMDLIKILRMLRIGADVEVEFYENYGGIRYHATFRGQKGLKVVTDSVIRKKDAHRG
jgi:hypothetical protein